MAKLTKEEAKYHHEAEKLLTKPAWDDNDRDFFLTHWQESANHVNSAAGAFFTPLGLALDAMLDCRPGHVVDLCAGIGTLSLAAIQRQGNSLESVTCIEVNPAYAEIGRRLVPEARWIVGNVFEELPKLNRLFDTAISNPPFGRIKHEGTGPRYKGSEFELQLIDLAADHAKAGVFIIPQMSAGFRYSGAQYYERQDDTQKVARFQKQTGIVLDIGVGVDTSAYRDDWHGVAPQVEVACVDFEEIGLGKKMPIPVSDAVAEPANAEVGNIQQIPDVTDTTHQPMSPILHTTQEGLLT